MLSKGDEYSKDTDKLHNFNKGARMTNKSREEVIMGFLLKHIISLDDIIENIKEGKLPTKELLDEKITDIVNYHILLEASIIQRIEEREEVGDKQ